MSPAKSFGIFRILFGGYLFVHFTLLLPHAAELFSREGMLADCRLNFTAGLLPNPLEHWDSPAFCQGFIGVLAGLALAFACGVARRPAAVLLWFGWACLFNRNNLISNPSIPYVGVLLLLCAIIPAGEPWALSRRREAWKMPGSVPVVAWLLMAAGYTFSGIAKLSSPSWQDGSALWHVLQNPLARLGPVRDLVLSLPAACLQVFTWGALAAEILFLPMCAHRTTRFFAWLGMVLMHAGILLTLDFADLSLGMLMIHLFTLPQALADGRRIPMEGEAAAVRASDFPAPALPSSRDCPPGAWPDTPAPH